jgi:formiminotetrahydrofolate cyclodeaminase
MEIKDKSIEVFLAELASKSATPGGGSAAAVMGAQAAALVSMVCHLTIGKPKYALVEAEMQSLLQQAEVLRHELVGMIKSDVDVFNQVMAAYGLSKETEKQKTFRSAAIQEALKAATEVPLACAKACAQVITLSKVAAEKGSTAVISDAGVAVMAGYAGLKSAALNVYVNTGSLKDIAFAQAKLVQLEHILDGAGLTTEEVYQVVKNKL